jgi:hypothetical protein
MMKVVELLSVDDVVIAVD